MKKDEGNNDLFDRDTPSLDLPSPEKDTSIPDFFAERYRVIALLGAGGMGRIYKAFDQVLQRYVALKFLIADNPDHERRLMLEAQSQARLEHDYVCKIFDLGKTEGRAYIAMQYVDGKPLHLVSKEMGLEQKVRLVGQIAEGIHAAHQIGLIHRDIKPSNVLVERTADGDLRPCIVDFGLVKDITRADRTRTGMIHGTPHYMSPEQALGEAVDRRADVYSLGSTLYELLTDRLPHEGSIVEVLMKLMREEPAPPRAIKPSIPRDLENIVLKSMEKKREIRYQSARELSQDLNRHLQGEPVQARPIGPVQRLTRRALRHKATSAVLLVAFLFALSFAVLGLRAHFSARRQASLAQEFGQVVKEMQGVMRIAYLLPLHSVERERAIVLERMNWIEKQMQEVGQIGYGPGHYALGSANFSLQEYDRAFEHLEKTWQSGYQEPEVAYLLGLVNGELYQSAMKETERIPDAKLRKARVAELEKQYRDPALSYLKRGEGLRTESKEYVEGLLAFYGKDWEKALNQAGRAVKQIPWLYEAHQLEGNVYLSRGREEFDRGSHEEAAADFEKAEERFRLAVEMGSNDSRLYEDTCRLRSAKLSLTIAIGGDPKRYYESAIDACDQALVANPQSGEAYDQAAQLHIQWARNLIDRGVSPEEALKRSLQASEQAAKRMPQKAPVYNSAGMAFWLMAEYALQHGQDPTGFLNNGIAAFDKALRINPNQVHSLNYKGNCNLYLGQYAADSGKNPEPFLLDAAQNYQMAIKIEPEYMSPHTNLGLTYLNLAMNSMGVGKDPRDWLHRDIASLQNAVKINPTNAYPLNSMGTAYGILGSYAIDHGEDPGKLLEDSIGAFAQAIRIKPDWPYPYNNTGLGYLDKARYAEMMEEDPSPFLEKAKESFHKALELNPEYGEAWMSLGTVHLGLARHDLLQQHSPLESLKEGDVCLSKALQSLGENPDLLVQRAEMELVRVRWQMQDRTSPRPALDLAHTSLSRAIKLNPNSEQPYRILAELYYRQAQWRADRNIDFQVDVEQGLLAAEKALSLNPDSADSYGNQGLLLMLQSRASLADEDRARSAQRAENAFRKALEINPNLKHKYSAKTP